MKTIILAAMLLSPTIVEASEMLAATKVFCAGEWPGDYKMQKYCIDNQMGSLVWVATFIKENKLGTKGGGKPEILEIVGQCISKWSGDTGKNWVMSKFCIETQFKAYKSLQ